MSVEHQNPSIQQQTLTRSGPQERGPADQVLDSELPQAVAPLIMDTAHLQRFHQPQQHLVIQHMQEMHGNQHVQRQAYRSQQSPQITPPRKPQPTVDWGFISQKEGGQHLIGYVPNPKGSKSGVTIATGFDVGARNVADLKKLGLPQTLVTKLMPYLGLKGLAALAELQKHPLNITKQEADVIDRSSKRSSLDDLIAKYNKASSIRFESLPVEAQTVIASVSFQYGTLAKATPSFWRHVTKQDWVSAIKELENFGDSYRSRRKSEAALLRKIVSKP